MKKWRRNQTHAGNYIYMYLFSDPAWTVRYEEVWRKTDNGEEARRTRIIDYWNLPLMTEVEYMSYLNEAIDPIAWPGHEFVRFEVKEIVSLEHPEH